MRLSFFLFALLLLVLPFGAAAQSTPNPDFYYGAVIGSFRKHDPGMVHFSLIYKGQVSEDLDVILVRGGSPSRPSWREPRSIEELFQGDLLGVFLISRTNPAVAYELAIETDLTAEIIVERDEPGELTVRPLDDYGRSGLRRKYFYLISNKQLLAKKDFWPDGLEQAFSIDGQVILWGRFPDLSRRHATGPSLAVMSEGDGFREVDPPLEIDSAGPGAAELVAFGDGCKLLDTGEDPVPRMISCTTESGDEVNYKVPLAEFDRFAAARPAKVPNGYTQEQSIFNETIGPHQVIGKDLWFGITFYDGEGRTGIGGFGYFDSVARQFEIRYPPEMADWSVSALLVEPEAIWMGLAVNPEGVRYSGGLLRWDRGTETVQQWPDGPVMAGIARRGERLYMATDEGAAIFEKGQFTRYLLDVDQDGEYRLVEREVP